MRTETTLIYEHTFAAAHRLHGHKGKCKNIHGHNYKATIELQNFEFDGWETDMVMDFYDVKKIVADVIDSNFDHKIILQHHDKHTDQTTSDMNIYWMQNRPTTENLARRIFDLVNDALPIPISCIAVTLEESPGKRVRVCIA